MQKDIRDTGLLTGGIGIGFVVFKINPDEAPVPLKNPLSSMNPYIYKKEEAGFVWERRDITKRFRLPSGTYVIVPCTNESNSNRGRLLTVKGYKVRGFYLRIFAEAFKNSEEYDKSFKPLSIDTRLSSNKNVDSEFEEYRQLEEYFQEFAGYDSLIGWVELKNILDKYYKPENQNERCPEDICRLLVSYGDFDKTGKLGLQEFRMLWKDISIWAGAFELYEGNKSGYLKQSDLADSLRSAGFQVNKNILIKIQKKYGDNNKETISFKNFLVVACKLKTFLMEIKGHINDYL